MAAKSSPPVWFWVVSGICLLWNLAGLAAFAMQVTMSPEALAALPQAEKELYETVPAWATAAFALAVVGGTLGCLALLMRKAWATPIFIASLVGILVQNFHSFALSKAPEVFGATAVIMPLFVIVVAVFLVWFSRMAKARDWI